MCDMMWTVRVDFHQNLQLQLVQPNTGLCPYMSHDVDGQSGFSPECVVTLDAKNQSFWLDLQMSNYVNGQGGFVTECEATGGAPGPSSRGLTST